MKVPKHRLHISSRFWQQGSTHHILKPMSISSSKHIVFVQCTSFGIPILAKLFQGTLNLKGMESTPGGYRVIRF